MKTFDARTLERWRAWLRKHHTRESEIWLLFHKKHTGKPSVAYEDAVDEALCFGWIDSLIKRVDADRYARKFTPRTPESSWSTINVKRYAALKAANRLTRAGIDRAPTTRIVDAPKPTKVPLYVEEALKPDAEAWTAFEKLAPSYRRKLIGWIDSAKRDETKQKRLRQAVKILKSGRKPGIL